MWDSLEKQRSWKIFFQPKLLILQVEPVVIVQGSQHHEPDFVPICKAERVEMKSRSVDSQISVSHYIELVKHVAQVED